MLGTVDAILDAADDDTLCCVIWDGRYPGEMDAIGLESLLGENSSASVALVSVCCLVIIIDIAAAARAFSNIRLLFASSDDCAIEDVGGVTVLVVNSRAFEVADALPC